MIIIFHPQGESELDSSEDQYEELGHIINIPSLFSQPGQFSLIEDDLPGGIGDLEISPADLADLATIEDVTTTKPTVR